MRPVCLPLMKNFFSTRDHGCISLSLRFTELSTGSMYQVVFTTIAGISLPSGNTTFNCFVKDHPAPQTQHPLRSYSASVLMKTSVFTNFFFFPCWCGDYWWSAHVRQLYSKTITQSTLFRCVSCKQFCWLLSNIDHSHERCNIWFYNSKPFKGRGWQVHHCHCDVLPLSCLEDDQTKHFSVQKIYKYKATYVQFARSRIRGSLPSANFLLHIVTHPASNIFESHVKLWQRNCCSYKGCFLFYTRRRHPRSFSYRC